MKKPVHATATAMTAATRGALLSLSVGLAMSSGCRDDTIDVGDLEMLELQPTERFAIGSTFYLPTPAQGRWTLAEAPSDNDNVVIDGRDGYARFTPVVPGEYAFVIEGSSERRTLRVVDDVPFEHFNYYQTSSMTMVDGELWVTHLFDPHISRVDPTSGQVLGTLDVGPWPAAVAYAADQGVVLIAHKAADTIGIIDRDAGHLVDALWVGDEPAQIVLSPDGGTAYVTLATEGAIVVVDVANREVTGRVATNINPTTMALSDDGTTLYVASYLTGVSDRQQFGTDERNDAFDIAVVDTASLEVTDYIQSVGSVIGGLLLDGQRLYVSTTRVQLEQLSPFDEQNTAFQHSVVVYDTATRTEILAADLGRQPTAAGIAVRPFGLALSGGTLWVTTEGSDLVVGLDPQTLAETTRFPAEGRPRAILADGDRLYVHGAQAYRVTMAGNDGAVLGTTDLTGDPRHEGLALGQSMYTGVGARGGYNHSCADCHVDGLTDGNVWRAGFASSASRPVFWLEGTAPIGWEGDAYDLRSYLYGSPAPTIGVIPTTETFQVFYDYLSAIVPPPPANGWTRRDGSPTELAQRGEALFNGKGACVGCHASPLTTQGLRLPDGGTDDAHPIVVPSLVGSYRHSFWLVNGAARTLEEAVVAMLPLAGSTLDDAEVSDVAQYLRELTARELFVLASMPRAGATQVRNEGPLTLTLSHPVFDDPQNLARIVLRATGGEAVEMVVEADARHLTLTPTGPLLPGQAYELVIPEDFEAFSGRILGTPTTIPFTVAAAPDLRLEGEYVLTVQHPVLDSVNGIYDNSIVMPVPMPMSATVTSYGAVLSGSPTEQTAFSYDIVVEGDEAYFPPFAFPSGPTGFFNRSFPSQITLVDDDGDGVADRGESTLMFRSPGLEATDVRWSLSRPSDEPVACDGQEGMVEVDLMLDATGQPTIDWGADVGALGYYVTAPEAMPPAGPGPVTGGETYWAISTSAFPTGFVGPVRYGEVPEGASDVSVDSGAPEGGAALVPGQCVKLSVSFDDFSTTTLRYEVPAG